MNERQRVNSTAPFTDLPVADDTVDWPIASFDEHIGATIDNPCQRRILIEPSHQIHRGQGCDHRQTVGQTIHRPIIAFAKTFDGEIAVQRHHQRRAQCAGLCQQSHMPAMQDIETAVGEYQWSRQTETVFGEILWRDDFFFEGRLRVGYGGRVWRQGKIQVINGRAG